MNHVKSLVLLLMLSALVAGLGGCNQTPHAARQAVMYYDMHQFAQAAAALEPTIEQERTKMDENYVINNLRYGSCALAAGQFKPAKDTFGDAYKVINSTKTNDAGRQLGAAVVFEGVKVWKGEPFERAMADYYLGLLYLMDHNYGTARAAFQESIFSLQQEKKDKPDDFESVPSNFALGYFGLGYSNLRLGRADLASQNFADVHRLAPQLDGLVAAVQNPRVNGLIFVDAGIGPRKGATGWYNERVVFGPPPEQAGPVYAPVAVIDGRQITDSRVYYSMVDTLAMAQDRKWMDIDTIKEIKAVLGTGMMAGGTAVAANGAAHNNRKEEAAGVGIAVVGALVAASSQSDTRYWEMLPRTVYIIPVTLTPGTHDVSVAVGNDHQLLTMTYAPPPAGQPADPIFYFRLH